MSSRSIIAILFVLLSGVLAMFLWKKQIEGYSFSLENERAMLKGAANEMSEIEEELHFPEIPEDEIKQAIEIYERMQESTSTIEVATSTANEEEWIKLFTELENLEQGGSSPTNTTTSNN